MYLFPCCRCSGYPDATCASDSRLEWLGTLKTSRLWIWEAHSHAIRPDSELIALMRSVRRVGSVVQRAYGADALTIACQDGPAAGQSVPHVHFHILPRKAQGDRFSEDKDAIYPELETTEASLMSDMQKGPQQKHQPFKVDADEDRKPRSIEEMVAEAKWLKDFFTEDDLREQVD